MDLSGCHTSPFCPPRRHGHRTRMLVMLWCLVVLVVYTWADTCPQWLRWCLQWLCRGGLYRAWGCEVVGHAWWGDTDTDIHGGLVGGYGYAWWCNGDVVWWSVVMGRVVPVVLCRTHGVFDVVA